MSVARSCILVVRQIVTVAGVATPKVPAGWDVLTESNGWCTIWPGGRTAQGQVIHARMMVQQGANGAFILFGPRTWLDQIQALVTNSWASIAALRADSGATATTIKAAWLDDRARDSQGVLLAPSDPIVALRARMAGFESDDGETTGP